MSLMLYYAPSTISLATVIALEEAGLDYQHTRLDFGSTQQQSPEYLKINPKGRVPALVTEQGILTETPALLAYVAALAPDAGLMPGDPWGAAQADAIMSYFASTMHVAHAHRMRGHRWADDPAAHEAMRAKVPANMAECFTHVEQELFKGPWVMGDSFTVCDAYLFTIARWIASDGLSYDDFPVIDAHRTRMMARPAVQRAVDLAA